MRKKKRVAICISGRGSNMERLITASEAPDYPAEIVGVISNRPDANGLEIAKSHNIPTQIVRLKDFPEKKTADEAITKTLTGWDVDIVCLAGFMRLLSAEFCARWQGAMINIHPSLLPDFPGLNTHQRALDDEISQHGCTVHYVTAEMDQGPIIGQVAVPVLYGDTATMLSDRVLAAEHKLYPWALSQVASGDSTFDNP